MSVLHDLVEFMDANGLTTLSTEQGLKGYKVYVTVEKQEEAEKNLPIDPE